MVGSMCWTMIPCYSRQTTPFVINSAPTVMGMRETLSLARHGKENTARIAMFKMEGRHGG